MDRLPRPECALESKKLMRDRRQHTVSARTTRKKQVANDIFFIFFYFFFHPYSLSFSNQSKTVPRTKIQTNTLNNNLHGCLAVSRTRLRRQAVSCPRLRAPFMPHTTFKHQLDPPPPLFFCHRMQKTPKSMTTDKQMVCDFCLLSPAPSLVREIVRSLNQSHAL